MTWEPGTTILVDEVWNGRLWARRPVVVVDDDPARLVVWCPQGSVRKVPTTAPGRPRAASRGERLARCLLDEEWVLVDHVWDVSTLMLTEPGALHATWVSFLQDGSHWGWYVNLQRPFTRSDSGITTMDLALDVLIEPDCSGWRWKDEDEFQLLVDAGLLDASESTAVRDEALRVLARVEAREPPFSEDWPRWRARSFVAAPDLGIRLRSSEGRRDPRPRDRRLPSRRRHTSGTITCPMRHTSADSVASGHPGCPWGQLGPSLVARTPGARTRSQAGSG